MKPVQVSRDGQTLGEFDPVQIQEGMQTGYFQATDWFWIEGMPSWSPLANFTHPQSQAVTFASPVISQGPIRSVTANKAPLQLKPLFQAASPWKRLVAALVDVITLFVCCTPLAFVTGGESKDTDQLLFFITLGFFAMWAVLNISMTIACAQTFGKKAAGIRIVDMDGSPADVVTIIVMRNIVGRYLLCILPIYGIVDILFIFSEGHRCLHDRIAGTQVVLV